MFRPLAQALVVSLILICSTGCHIGYITRASIEEANILLTSRKIDTLLKSANELTIEDREKLSLVKEARAFGITTIGLDPKNSFTRYTDIGKSELAWVLIAVKDDSFELMTWWFPIVGRVPYIGFFDKEDAEHAAAQLQAKGFETSVRSTDAFSTLGWFNDPVLSTTLKRDPLAIVSTVLHESLHTTIWLPGSVAFNESLAQFVGLEGTRNFYKQRTFDKRFSKDDVAKTHRAVDTWVDGQKRVARIVDTLMNDLTALFNCSCLTREEKLAEKAALYKKTARAIKKIFPAATMLQTPNNAELVQASLYMTKTHLFDQLFKKNKKSWHSFLEEIKKIKTLAEEKNRDPFEVVEEQLNH